MENDTARTSKNGQAAPGELAPATGPGSPARPLALPPAETAYLGEIVKRLKIYLGDRLAGVYLFGSAGYGAYEPGISDLDVQAIAAQPLSREAKLEIARQLSQQNLACPAPKLELVCYALPNVNPARRHPRFELNFNTGPGLPDHLTLDPSEESSHWFLLDIAMGRELGHPLFGPDPAKLFGPVPRRWCLEAIGDSLQWHIEHELSSANSVLNTCRSWRYIMTNRFGSKLAGAEWAIRQPGCPAVVGEAIQARHTGAALQPDEVIELYEIVIEANREASQSLAIADSD
jgi:hypothetical protein